MFKNNLSLKRVGDAEDHLPQKKIATEEQHIQVLSNVLLNPVYDLVSVEGQATDHSILYNMLSQSQSLNDTEAKLEMEEFIRLPPQTERPVQIGGKNISMLKHMTEELPVAGRRPDMDNSKIGGMVKIQIQNILALQEKLIQGVAAEKLTPAEDASTSLSSVANRQPDIDLDYPKRMVGGMLQNILALQEEFQRGVTSESRILAQLEAQVLLQKSKVNKLIEGANYLRNISEAMSSFNQFK